MTLILQQGLPAIDLLRQEGIQAVTHGQSLQNKLPILHIALLNLMPNKVETEVQIMRLLETPHFNIHLHLLRTGSYKSKNTSPEYLNAFYKKYDEIDDKVDGLIITGADVELMEFEAVKYWNELQQIMNWAEHDVKSTFFICWAAQAGVYHNYGIGKQKMKKKLSGVFQHKLLLKDLPISRDIGRADMVPHSRYTELKYCELKNIKTLKIVSVSKEAGVYLMVSADGKQVFATGHSEYDAETLKKEYLRDLKKGMNPSLPLHYFPHNDSAKTPKAGWRTHSKQLFSNWLRFYVNR